MAAIENDRDILLQATSPRVIPVKIPIDQVEGLPGILDGIDSDISTLGTEVNSLMGNTQDLSIRVSSLTVDNSTNTTLTVVRKNDISGTVSWTVFAGGATLSGTGDSRTIAGNSISGSSVTVRAAIGSKEVFATINKVGSLASQNTVNLSSQVTGQLSSGNVSGLGSLALLNTVNLNTQTTGALNGQTQVTNLGTLAYANAIAANQIGAGTLAAGVIYAGTINADKINAGSFSGKDFTGGTFTGTTFRTNPSNTFPRIEINGGTSDSIRVYNSVNDLSVEVIGNGIRAKAYSFSEAIVISPGASSSANANGMSVTVPGYGIQVDSSFCPIFLEPKSSFPSQQPARGGLLMHTAHGLCISDGTQWLKTTWTPV